MSLPLGTGEFIQRLERVEENRVDGNQSATVDTSSTLTLDESQRRAVGEESPLKIHARPGSGKSSVLVRRALKFMLVDMVHPESIMIMTFTANDSSNMRQRILNGLDERLDGFGYKDVLDRSDLKIGTSYSLYLNIMKEYEYKELDNFESLQDRESYIKDNCAFVSVLCDEADTVDWESVDGEIDGVYRFFEPINFGQKLNGPPNRDKAAELAARLFDHLSHYRVDTKKLRKAEEPALRLCAEGLDRYRETLRNHGRWDFPRLLEMFLRFLDSPVGQQFVESDPEHGRQPIKHILIDEYQDTSLLQEEICFRLMEKLDSPNLTVVGDDNQGLFRFAGGRPEAFSRIQNRVSKQFNTSVNQVQLTNNYRSKPDIVSWCNQYLANYPLMQYEGTRQSEMNSMDNRQSTVEDLAGVYALLTDDIQTTAEQTANIIKRLKETGEIGEFSDVAFLVRTIHDHRLNRLIETLEDQGIPTTIDKPNLSDDRTEEGVLFISTHAARSFEFPVVFVYKNRTYTHSDGIYWLEDQLQPYAEFDLFDDAETRAERDAVRWFYVSYTRAESHLFLLNPTEPPVVPLGYSESGQPLQEKLPVNEDIVSLIDNGITGATENFFE